MPTPLTGRIYWDKNGNDAYDVGTDSPFASINVELKEVTFFDGYDTTVSTDANGLYSIDSTGTDPNGQTTYNLIVSVPPGYFLPFFPFFNPYPFVWPPAGGFNIDFAFAQMQCTRIAERWVKKVCFLPSVGVRVTFDDRGKLFTALYPNTTIDDYNALIASPDKGVWIHHFFYKKKVYIPWPISP
jgi:hypothetical protein